MICPKCREQNHDKCEGKEIKTRCDCQHKPSIIIVQPEIKVTPDGD